MTDWVGLDDALEQARDMVTTALVTLTLKNSIEQTYLVEIYGIEHMFKLVSALKGLKKTKKIKDFAVANLSQYTTITVDDLIKAFSI